MMRRTLGKSRQKCMEDKKSLKKIEATMENKDNIPRYECGWTTSTVKNLFAMCFMTFRI